MREPELAVPTADVLAMPPHVRVKLPLDKTPPEWAASQVPPQFVAPAGGVCAKAEPPVLSVTTAPLNKLNRKTVD